MKEKLLRRWPLLYGLMLLLFTLYILLDAFVIPRSFTAAEGTESAPPVRAEDAVITENSYSGGGVTIAITRHRAYDTDIYVADVVLEDPAHIRTAFAKDTFGKNIIAPTSVIAAPHDAILAVNGDYYSARSGYVLRNGVLYRESSAGKAQQDLVIGTDGSFTVCREGDFTAQELLDAGAAQVLSFGPGLIEEGEVSFDPAKGQGKELTRNPRTAMGWYGGWHYVFVVADGRTERSEGLTLQQLANFLHSLGVRTAYNLDGGGSATMVFNGQVVNQPTDGHNIEERNVSDIVYIG